MELDHWRRTRTIALPSDDAELTIPPIKVYNMQYFGADMAFGKMRHADVMRSMALFAREVIPKFR
jgi:hypothetical protein